jgi:hypothetical protein
MNSEDTAFVVIESVLIIGLILFLASFAFYLGYI